MTEYSQIATLAQPEVASVGKQRSIGIRKTSDGSISVGEIIRIEEEERTEKQPQATKATVCVRHGPKPSRRKGRDIDMPYPYPPESQIYVPIATARDLKVGQKVRIVLEPVT